MAEAAAVGSSEDVSEETEDPEALEPDDGGEKVSRVLPILTPSLLSEGESQQSEGLRVSGCAADRKFPTQPRQELAKSVPASARLGSQRRPRAASVSGTFQQVTNLLDIMDSESAQTDAVGAGPDMRRTLASAIITEKATAEPGVVLNALTRCLQVPEVGPPRPRPLPGAQPLGPLARPPAAQHTGAGLGAGVQRGAGRGVPAPWGRRGAWGLHNFLRFL